MVLDTLLSKVIGTQNERELKRIQPLVARINGLEPSMQQLSDAQLRGKTAEFRERFAKGETLDDLLPEAFAVVREAGRRVVHMRHYDVQLIGGVVLGHFWPRPDPLTPREGAWALGASVKMKF